MRNSKLIPQDPADAPASVPLERIAADTDPIRGCTKVSPGRAHCYAETFDPAKLGAMLRGELDWIVMKALEKDRTRRYETASGMAADVQRLLDNEPIVARPPSLVYRFTKFARRNHAVVISSALVLMLLVAGITGTTWMAAHAWQQKGIAEDLLEKGRAILFDNVMMFALAGDVKRTVHELDRTTDKHPAIYFLGESGGRGRESFSDEPLPMW